MRFASVVPLLLLTGLFGNAQDFRATISGIVTDRTGAAVPNAKVRAIHKATGEVAATTTDRDGFYTLPYLQPSTYRIEAEAEGFNLQRFENVALMVAEKRDLPIALALGKVSTQITVMAEIAGLQTVDASGGVNFDALQTS